MFMFQKWKYKLNILKGIEVLNTKTPLLPENIYSNDNPTNNEK